LQRTAARRGRVGFLGDDGAAQRLEGFGARVAEARAPDAILQMPAPL